MHAPLAIGLPALAALGAWSALLTHRGLANFNDGVRPVVGEWVRGNLTREELAGLARDLSRPFLEHGAPFTVISSIMLAWPLLLVADIIGTTVANPLLALFLGGVWGGILELAIHGIYRGLEAMPVNVIAAFTPTLYVFLWGLAALPIVAAGYQFGARVAIGAGIVSAAVWLDVQHLAISSGQSLLTASLSASTAALLAGLAILVGWSVAADLRAGQEEAEDLSDLGSGAERLRQHLAWFIMQGAILGFAVRSFSFSWNQTDLLAIAAGYRFQAAALALVMAVSFWPAIVTSSISSGVYQTVGMATIFIVAYLSPNEVVAAVLGATVLAVEILLLPRTNAVLVRLPTLRGTAESLRAAYEFVIPVVVLVGSVLAAGAMIPGGVGYLIVIMAVIINERFVQRLHLMEAPLLAAMAVGLIANLLVWSGYMNVPIGL